MLTSLLILALLPWHLTHSGFGGWIRESGPPPSASLECESPAQASIGKQLVITAVEKPCGAYGYASDLVRSPYSFTYGYVQARVWLPSNGNGGVADWPVFWMLGNPPWALNGESDIAEGDNGRVCITWHWGEWPNALQTNEVCPPGDWAGWHTYGEDWEPGSITYYYDGRAVDTIAQNITGEPQHVIFSLSVPQNDPVPAAMKVSSFQVWQDG